MQKEVVYDEVLAFTGQNGPLDVSLQKLQADLRALRIKIYECEQYYHGEGDCDAYKAYNKLYADIGNASAGMWGNAAICYQIITAMNLNAQKDAVSDASGIDAASQIDPSAYM